MRITYYRGNIRFTASWYLWLLLASIVLYLTGCGIQRSIDQGNEYQKSIDANTKRLVVLTEELLKKIGGMNCREAESEIKKYMEAVDALRAQNQTR